MVILVKLRITLCGHTRMSHDHVYTVRNMNLHLSSRQRTFVDPQTVIEVVGNSGRIRAAHLAFTSQGIQDFILCVSAEAFFEIN